jgi:DNA-directed RNA polymerase beta' subunit
MIDAKKTIDKLRGEADRERYSVYFSSSLYEEFKNHCGEISPSKVLEELMKEFIESSKATRSDKKKKVKRT